MIIEWFTNNIQWLFSGIGVTALIAIYGWLKHKNSKGKKIEIRQEQNNTDSLNNTQIGIQNNYSERRDSDG